MSIENERHDLTEFRTSTRADRPQSQGGNLHNPAKYYISIATRGYKCSLMFVHESVQFMSDRKIILDSESIGISLLEFGID